MTILFTSKAASLTKLAEELLTSRAGASGRTEAVRALRAANPGLTRSVPAGTPLVLPDLPHLRARLDHVGAVAGREPLARVVAVVKPLPDAMAARSALAASRAADLAAAVVTAPKAVAEGELRRYLSKTRLSAATKRAEADAEGSAALARAFADAAPRWARELATLEGRLQRTG